MVKKQPHVAKHISCRGLESIHSWDYENGYHWFSHPSRMGKLLAHYELYKSIVSIPGHVFELGVYKGASLIRFATFRATLESEFSRKIVGFDAFGKFPTARVEGSDDIRFIENFEGEGGGGLTRKELSVILDEKGFQNIELVEGNIFETLCVYLNNNPATRISLLHLDMDVKEPTLYALNEIYDRVVRGGLIVIDDYNAVNGATDAVDEFIKDKKLQLEKMSFYNVPAFIRKND